MIAKSGFSRCWQRIGGCVALVGTLTAGISQSMAQIAPDNTLGSERSVITPDVTIQGIQSGSSALQSVRIDGGAIRGANLFHSFSQFNVDPERGAYFTNPAGINNILARVTGANRSEILGRLGVLGTANLFLINPNGIVFGGDASLDVQGSFVATTANAVQFPNSGSFSASMPAAPSSLLTVNPSAFLFNQVPVGAITNDSRTPVGTTPIGNQFGLRVADGRSLLLLGGNIRMDGGGAIAPGGRIELGAIAQPGTVRLSVNGNDLSLSFPGGADQAEISLSNGALVSVSGERSGDVQVQGRRITLSGGSQIRAINTGAGTGGTLAVRAEDAVELVGVSADGQKGSGLIAQSQGSGDAGNLTIDTRRLLVQGGARISVGTSGQGKGGSLLITAEDAVEVRDRSADGRLATGLFAQSQGSGNAGNLTINTGRLLVQGGAQVSVSTFGSGKGGSLQVTADSIELSGTSADRRTLSGLFAQSRRSGDAGNLSINTRRLLVQGGAQVGATTFGSGKGGSLQITADAIELSGVLPDSSFPSGLFAQSQGSGDAGNLSINTGRLLMQGGAQVSVGTSDSGKGGSLLITADAVELSGTSADGQFASGLFTRSQGSGDAGNLSINTRRLLVQGGAQASVGTSDLGKGGSLLITADAVELSGTSADGQTLSGLSASSRGSGDAGNLTIDTRRLLVQGGAQVSVGTRDRGKGGSLLITAEDAVELSGTSADGRFASALSAQSQGSGNAGNLSIDTRRLLVQDKAVISSRSFGTGTAGDINITARDTLQANNGTIRTDSAQTQGGAITIRAGKIRLFDQSDIRSNVASGADNGGNITLTANSILAFGDSDILAFARDGRGGNITLNTPAFFGQNYRPAPPGTNPDTLSNNDRVDVNASGVVSGIITVPDVTFIQNSLTELPDTQINTDTLLANSCIVRRDQPTRGSFIVTGTGGFEQRPGETQPSSFPTVSIETLPSQSSSTSRTWQKGDPIVEPQGVYRLPNGKVVLSRRCS